MDRQRTSSAFGIMLTICLFLALQPLAALDRNQCNNMVIQKLKNGSLSPFDPIFYRDSHGIMSDPNNIGLTLPGCDKTCGRGFNFYEDVGPRLTTWLIPVIILIGNMTFAPLGPVFLF